MAVTDEAIEKIREMIISGQLRPGDRLPKEDELASLLGLSRSSLREAVRALSLVRILDVRQGDGTYVTSLKPELLLDAVSFVVDFHHDDSVLSFLEVRRMLEPQATAVVARTATAPQVAELQSWLGPGTSKRHTDQVAVALWPRVRGGTRRLREQTASRRRLVAHEPGTGAAQCQQQVADGRGTWAFRCSGSGTRGL